MTPDEIRAWAAGLGLSVTEAGEALNLTDPNNAFRDLLKDRKRPAPPTVLLMETQTAIATALVCLRTGRTDDARRALEGVVTPAIKRTVRERAPGLEAVGAPPAPPPPPGRITRNG